MVSGAYAAGGDSAGNGTAVERKCDLQGKTAYAETVYSLYYYNILGGNPVDALPAGRFNTFNAYLCINSCAFFKKVL